jgi:hypothetical protein
LLATTAAAPDADYSGGRRDIIGKPIIHAAVAGKK